MFAFSANDQGALGVFQLRQKGLGLEIFSQKLLDRARLAGGCLAIEVGLQN
jgi:hypothetical protein